MINKKLILGLFIISFLGGCTSPTAMLGPAYTLSSTGSVYQSGLTYGSNELITLFTGNSPIENIKKISSSSKKKNIKEQTLKSDDFHILVKKRIEKTSAILNSSNQ
tara:strand:+ start:268 stop:585 length:318 start_codon:yes stop_codon:yes gene_type:complete